MGSHVRAALLSALPLARNWKAPNLTTLCHRPQSPLHPAGRAAFSTQPSSSSAPADDACPNGMSDQLRKFITAEKSKVVTFKVRGEVFHGSKLVLAMRSGVFARMLYGLPGEEEHRIQDLTIEDDTDPAAFKALLHYVDTDSSPHMDELSAEAASEVMVRHLFVAADKYGIGGIKTTCELALIKRLKVETVASTLALAHQHGCTYLKDACIGLINSSDRHEVISSRGYGHLKKECLPVFVELWEKSARSCK